MPVRPGPLVRPGLAAIVFLVIVLLLGLTQITVDSRVGDAQKPVEEILANVRQATGLSQARQGFRQDIRMRLFLFSWRFHTDVVQDEHGVSIETVGAPSFIPRDMSASLLEVSEAFEDFDLRLVEEQVGPNGTPVYLLRGERRDEGATGALEGKLWVNGETWHVDQVEARYSWGTVEVEQTYQTVEGHTVLARQNAFLKPLGARFDIEYKDYWFDGTSH